MTDVKVEKKGSVAVVTLSSKSGLNYMDVNALRLLSREVEKLDVDDDSVRTIVLRGSEKAFSSGIDPTYFVRNVNAEVLDEMFENFDKIANVKKVTIAEASGYAVGIGFEIALACDMLFCSDNTWFSAPDLSLGTVAGFGVSQRLPKAIGKAKTMEMLLTGRAMGAEEAERIGLVSRVIPLSYLHKEVLKVADIIASMPNAVLATSKELIKTAIGNTGLAEGLEIEKQVYKNNFDSDEYRVNLENMVKNGKNR